MIALFASAFALGLATSAHCISMCGPMVVTYAVRSAEDAGWKSTIAPNLAYHGARTVSYVVTGLALGAIGSAFRVDAIRPWIMAVAGVFMVLLGIGMTGRFPWAARLTPRPPAFLIRALTRLRRKAKADAEEGESTLMVPVAFGLLTGLMPCAPLQAAQLSAAASGSAMTGGLVMFAFALGTAPLMLVFGTVSTMLSTRWKERLHIVLAIVVIVSGLVFLGRAAALAGVGVGPLNVPGIFGGQGAEAPQLEFTVAPDGVAEVPLVIQSVQYFPSTLAVPAGREVRLIVDRREDDACSDRLVIPRMDVDVALAPNATTVVVLPASDPGTYSMTCGMGMMSGEIVVLTP